MQKVLFSWVDLEEDLKKKRYRGAHKDPKNSKILNGPTLQLLNLEKFDDVHLFFIHGDEPSKEKAINIKSAVEKYRSDFKGRPKFEIYGIEILHAADYQNLWEVVPMAVKEIIEDYNAVDSEIFFNVSSGSRAMTSTWLFMVGTEEYEATIISPQFDKKNKKPYIHNLDLGTYPHVNKIKHEVEKTLNIVHEYKSKQMREIFGKLRILSDINVVNKFPILITGETGTGKTTVAEKFHEMRKIHENEDVPFVKVLCGEFDGNPNLANSTIFGHKKGAYTGADEDRIGMLQEADGGTVFFDEIANLPMSTQNVLLDVIEGRPFRRLGSNDDITSDFQLICATNSDIEELVANRVLRGDFVARIDTVKFEIPPVRQRPEDIEGILEGLLKTSDFINFEIEIMAKKNLLSFLKKSYLKSNIRDIRTILVELYFMSQEPPVHALTSSEVEKFFRENKEPTKDDEFIKSVGLLLNLWPNTSYAEAGEKWKEALMQVAVKKLSESPNFRKKDGELNRHKITKTIGIDPKTIKKHL